MSVTFQPRPAVIQMLDHRRGDLYVAVTDDRHYAVHVESPLEGSEGTVGRFAPGQIGVDNDDHPMVIWLQPYATPVRCTPLRCRTICPECGASMAVEDDKFRCTECRNTL